VSIWVFSVIEIVKIPEDREAVLIGKGGSVKKKIEQSTGTEIEVSDIVKITGEDPLLVLKAKDVITAIGRGFSPKEAERLIGDDCELHVISLQGETLKKRTRLLGRVIGNDGRAKKIIENETGAAIAVKGKTVSVIGKPAELGPAEEALWELLGGKTHAHAYNMMRRRMTKS
jgi:ribosomal RNA assembly protein